MRLCLQRKLRPTLFLGLVALWLAASSLIAVPSLFWTGLAQNFANSKLALATDPTPLLTGSIGMTAEMVVVLEEENSGSAMIVLYGSEQPEALTRLAFRCRQFFYPRMVVAWRSTEDVAMYRGYEGPIYVLDYSSSSDQLFAKEFDLVSEFGLLRLWSRRVRK